MFAIYFHGALRVLIDEATGEVATVQDRISGEAASLRYSDEYIQAAKNCALYAFASQLEGI